MAIRMIDATEHGGFKLGDNVEFDGADGLVRGRIAYFAIEGDVVVAYVNSVASGPSTRVDMRGLRLTRGGAVADNCI
jgi:hypothetical protein